MSSKNSMKTVCIYHSIDLDGWMSAAIVKYWFITNNSTLPEMKKELIGYSYNTSKLDFIGYNYGDPIPNLSQYDRVIMCDVSFPKEEMIKLYIRLYTNLIWVDHHTSAIKDSNGIERGPFYDTALGSRDVKYAACELTWKYFFPDETVPEIVELLGKWDNIINVPITSRSEWQRVTEFQYGAKQYISNYEEAYEWLNWTIDDDQKIFKICEEGKIIYQYLCTETKQTYKNGFEITLEEFIPYTVKENYFCEAHTVNRKFICINREIFNPINFGIDYHKDVYDGAACFWYADGVWNFSLYNDNGLVDCSIIAKQYGGGGHKGAAGFIIDDITKII